MSVAPSLHRENSADYRQLFLSAAPLLDVRAPIEHQQGAFPASTNLPLMDNNEREAVGICYKQHGQEAALVLGNKLVSGELRESRLAQWRDYCLSHPNGYLYCFRGGLRSHIVQTWLSEAGINYPLVEGGYKALRNFLFEINQHAASCPMHIIGGNTGSGKTLLVRELRNGIDLEGEAHHRGSSFGRTLVPQSSQIDFENRVAIQLLHKQEQGFSQWVFEDEGRSIGANHVPVVLYDGMQRAPMVVIDDPFELRLARLQEEYIESMRSGFERELGEAQGWQAFCDYLHQGLYAIRKRLGLARYQQLSTVLAQALQRHLSDNCAQAHVDWLIPLLKEYYDPMYCYQLEQKKTRIVFRGTYAEVSAYLVEKGE